MKTRVVIAFAFLVAIGGAVLTLTRQAPAQAPPVLNIPVTQKGGSGAPGATLLNKQLYIDQTNSLLYYGDGTSNYLFTAASLWNRPIDGTAPSDGQALIWSATAGKWQPSTVSAGGSGTVTSVGVTAFTGLTVSGSPITGSGTISFTNALGTGLVKSTSGSGYSLATAGTDYEAALGNPTTNGYVLASTTTGTRSWVALPAAGGSGTVTSIDASGGSTGLTFSGGPVTTSGTVTLGGTLGIGAGGSGQTTANAALNAFLPSQGGNSGKFLKTNGSSASWATAAGATGTANEMAVFDGSGNLSSAAGTTWTTGSLPGLYLDYGTYVVFKDSSGGSGSYLHNSGSALDIGASSSGYAMRIAISSPAGAGQTVAFHEFVTLPQINSFGDAGLFAIDQSGTAHRAISTSDGNFLSGIYVGDPSYVLPHPVYSEAPSGSINGTNTDFTLTNEPINDSAAVYVIDSSGVTHRKVPFTDYSISGTTLSFITAPASGSQILVDYCY